MYKLECSNKSQIVPDLSCAAVMRIFIDRNVLIEFLFVNEIGYVYRKFVDVNTLMLRDKKEFVIKMVQELYGREIIDKI